MRVQTDVTEVKNISIILNYFKGKKITKRDSDGKAMQCISLISCTVTENR